MSETYSFDIAGEAFRSDPEMAKGPKDCSPKHDKVDRLKRDKDEAEGKLRTAAVAARAAYDEYLIWAHDHVQGPKYKKIYWALHADWEAAGKKVLDLQKKVHDAESAAWRCEASGYSG